MRQSALSLVLLLVSAASAAGARQAPRHAAIVMPGSGQQPSPPRWAPAYMVEYVVSMPSDFLMQPQGFSIPITAWYDGTAQRSRIESFGGMDTVLTLQGDEYSIHPRIDRLKCWAHSNSGLQTAEVKPVLPDIHKWQPSGDVELDGRSAHIWRLEFRKGQQVSTYNFYTAADDGAPLKLHMFGRNIMEDSHFDEYLYEFKRYVPLDSAASDGLFALPELCQQGQAEASGQRHWLARSLSMMFPSTADRAAAAQAVEAEEAEAGTNAIAGQAAEGGRGEVAGAETAAGRGGHWSDEAAHANWEMEQQRRMPVQDEAGHTRRVERFRQSLARVAAHNAQPDKTYTMQLGRFADWSEEEYYGILLPDAWRRRQGLPSAKQARREATLSKVPHAFQPLGKFKRRMKDSDLPRHVDWRGRGVDAGVKDQGFCGSCWAFAATGAMEAAWFRATGERRSFSEQQLVDCAFDWGVDACDGGDAEPAINFIAHSGGAAIEQDYYYQGVVGYCRAANHSRTGLFEGYLKLESRDELAMMEAVYTMGPLAVAVDASLDSFGFYKEGVYQDAKCSNQDLDHAVVLFGYGTSDQGVDYWLVKNSWSKLYGDDGFIKIARGSNDCGISTQGAIAVVSKQIAESRRQA